jgi:hypothetical protein
MIEQASKLPDNVQRLVDAGVKGIDVMHGQLKIDMLEAEIEYTKSVEIEEENDYSDAMESMDRKYNEGFLDALTYCYKLTYDISFAESIKEAGE